MLKIYFLCVVFGSLLVFTTSAQPARAAMCGAGNSGSCEISCSSTQRPIGDPSSACNGFNAGGTVCCSPAEPAEWPSNQCTALGGKISFDSDCTQIANTFNAGIRLDDTCTPSGLCCLESGKFNATNPLPNPLSCNPLSCVGSAPGAACRISCNGGEGPAPGVCPSGETCCIPGAGGICQSLGGTCVAGTCASQGLVASRGGSCVGASAGQTCCSAANGTAPIVGKLNYRLLEEIPGSSELRGDLGLYIQNLYKFTFWAIGVAALFMLTVGGFLYVTSAGNTSRIDTAKTIITDSLLGIVVALFAWIFLYVINPDLVENLKLTNTVRLGSTGGGGGTGGGTGPVTPVSDAKTLAQKILAGGSGITLNNGGNCSTADNKVVSPKFTLEQVAASSPVIRCKYSCSATVPCTDTTSINPRMLQAMLEVAKKYPFTVTSITGGRHCEPGLLDCKGLSAHYAGKAVDITTNNKADWPAIVEAFRAQFSDPAQTFCDFNGVPKPADKCNEANHIHVAF